jgi:hypothetical protein
MDTKTDPRLAPLAEACATVFAYNASNSVAPNGSLAFGGGPTSYWRDRAAAILAALPPDWCGHEVDAVYRERNAVVAALIRTNDWPAWYVAAPDADGWFIVYAESDEGQVSWHIGPQDIDLFSGWMSAGARAGWDGWDRHTTEEKYHRIAALRESPTIATLRAALDGLVGAATTLDAVWGDLAIWNVERDRAMLTLRAALAQAKEATDA